jgi:endonuclease/exonuclease/phosphatase family metal-dependent hydrolase
MPTIKIANWNVERPLHGRKKTILTRQKISAIAADVFVLTETSSALDLSDEFPYSAASISFDRTPDEQWVRIWSKFEISESICTFDNRRTACALIQLPETEVLIYGTIIPYHMAGVSGERYGNLGYKAWQYHEEDIYRQANDWERISNLYNKPIFVIGDFNQSRNGNKGYGTRKVRSVLTEQLERLQLICLTEVDFSQRYLNPDPRKGFVKSTIDHICVSKDFLKSCTEIELGAWDHFTEDGTYMSDHHGVYVSFEI